jgi:hypothetical protein
VDKSLEFAFDRLPQMGFAPMEDPRALKGLLDGRDRLLNETYQADILAILQAEADELRADRGRRRRLC